MSLLDRTVLYVGLLLAVIAALLSLHNLKELKSVVEMSKNTEDSRFKELSREINQLLKDLAPTTVSIRVNPTACPKGVAGSCCTQQTSSSLGLDPHGNPYVDVGNFVAWTFPTPKVDVQFPHGGAGSPFPHDYEYKSDSDLTITSREQVVLAAFNYQWSYGNIKWGNQSCQNVVVDSEQGQAIWPPGVVMRPPPGKATE